MAFFEGWHEGRASHREALHDYDGILRDALRFFLFARLWCLPLTVLTLRIACLHRHVSSQRGRADAGRNYGFIEGECGESHRYGRRLLF